MTPIKIITFILDDEPTIAELFNQVLNEDHKFEITSFTNPDDFLSAINSNVHLVILDINIPGFNYSVLKTIAFLQNNFPGIYIIVISAYLNVSIMSDFLRMGVFDAVEKGGNINWIEQLKEALDRVTRKINFKLEAAK